MATRMQLAIVSVTSGTVAIAAYVLLRRLLAGGGVCCRADRRKLHQSEKTAPPSPPAQEPSKIYEEKELLDQYMLFNFAADSDLLLFDDLAKQTDITNCYLFPKRIARLARDFCPDIFFSEQAHPRNVLDVGCAVGRSCFEFARFFDEVVGVDYSASFVRQCELMASQRRCEYECRLEGDTFQRLTAVLDADVDTSRVRFEVGDACNLRADLGEYNLVLASNLICRLVEPMLFLRRLDSLVKSRGYVILSTPFTWGAQYTPKTNWLGGQNGVSSADSLKSAMSETFDLCHELNMPMLIRETRRKFQYTVCLVTVWQKKL